MSEPSPPVATGSAGSWVSALDNRWLILGTLMLGLGAFGLPVLWRSRAFSRSAKVGWTIFITLETIAWWAGLMGLLYVGLMWLARVLLVG